MLYENSYNLEVSCGTDLVDPGQLFPSVDLLIQALKNIDKALCSAILYGIEHRRLLKDIGNNSFLFSIQVRLIPPNQLPLGQALSFHQVNQWVNTGRKELFGAALKGLTKERAFEKLHRSEKNLDLRQLFLYKEISLEDLAPPFEDLQNGLAFLGGQVEMYQSQGN